MQKNIDLTVVIATLGGASLEGTIRALNQSTMPPTEILICIPVELAERVKMFSFNNVLVLETEFRGQVAQRAFGFGCARYDIVMQIDDDILVDENCIELLVESLRLHGPSVAVAPALIDNKTGLSAYIKPKGSQHLLKFYYWIMNGADGYLPGRIDKSGSAVGVDPAESGNRFHFVEWLAGGCVLHYKRNLVLENYWPRPGKAYYEDVVHSSLLQANGIRLIIDSKAQCTLDIFHQSDFLPRDFFVNLYRDYMARRYFMRRFLRWSPRIFFFYSVRILSYIYSRLSFRLR